MDNDLEQLKAELEKIEKAIGAQESLRGILFDDQIESSLVSLKAQRDLIMAKLEGSSAIAQGESAKAVGKRGVLARDVQGIVITGNDNAVFVGDGILQKYLPKQAGKSKIRQATQSYLTHVIDTYRYLDFKGMGVSDRVPLRLHLTEMYVPLKARIELPEGETWARDLRIAGRHMSEEEAEDVSRKLSEPTPIVDLLRDQDGLIVLGDPGSGKTTFLKFLALCLAMGTGEEFGLADRLPILVPLSAYANALADKDVSLDQFLAQYYQDRGIALPFRSILAETLEEGGGFILMDGLDEVRVLKDRHIVVKRVIDFFNFHKQKGNKFILTSRIVGYREVRPNIKGLRECTLVDFDDEEILSFVDKWTVALEKAAKGDTQVSAQNAALEKDELLKAVHRNPGVRRLAANPLLLTILALMKRQGVTLPDRRVELYQKYVDTLLKQWNLARGLDRSAERELDVVETVRILAPLALWMHEKNPGVGLVKKEDIRRKLEDIYKQRGEDEPEAAAREHLADVREYAGLLLERGPGEYGFIHLTFQEYLAAVAIAQLGQRDVGPVIDYLTGHVGDDNWHEVTLLTVAYIGIIQQRDEAAAEVVLRLCKQKKGASGQAIVLAGEAAADAWPGGVTPRSKEKVVDILLATMTDDDHVAASVRAAAGNTLARLGDTRFRAGAWFLPDDGLLGFVEIPEGSFSMGTKEEDIPDLKKKFGGDEKWYKREIPLHGQFVKAYYMSVFPVTVAQFRAFVEESGRKPSDDDSLKGVGNHPVVYVSWYDAVAYCEWLTESLREWEDTPAVLKQKLNKDKWVVRLPSEAEWEKAARGDKDTRHFPFGDDIDPNKANYYDTRIWRTSPIGCFSKGASPYHIQDMSGNVFEWCSTKWEDDYQKYKDDNSTEGGDPRVLRGGAFYGSHGYVRCACRLRDFPGYGGGSVGFRIVIAPRINSDL